MEKNIPERTCIGCGEHHAKSELIRIVRSPEGEIHMDRTGRANGRGAYICNNINCLEKAISKKSLNRVFKEAVPKEVYDQLRGEFN